MYASNNGLKSHRTIRINNKSINNKTLWDINTP